MDNEQLNFTSNDIKGLQCGDKKKSDYLNNQAVFILMDLLFTRNTFASKHWTKWSNEFEGKSFISHCRTNSCGVALGYFGSKPFNQTL